MNTKKTVLITGASSGIGAAAALYFYRRGWNVAAAMRNPGDRHTAVHDIDDIAVFHLDVLDPGAIKSAVRAVQEHFGRIDALVNNAGYAAVGPFEASTAEQILRQFDTNVFGLMAVTREVLPIMRAQGGGVVINVASIGGRLVFPLYSLYHGAKWAVEGFTESLQHELRPFNIRVRLIEPGPVKTDFYDRSMEVMTEKGVAVYDEYARDVLPRMRKISMSLGAAPLKVAAVIFKAASGKSSRLRYSVGANGLLFLRRILPDRLFNSLIRTVVS